MVGPCHPSTYMQMPIRANGVQVSIHTSTDPAHPPTEAQWRVLERTLALVPPQHLKLLSYVQVSKPGCPPARGGGSDRSAHWIRLSAESVGASRNRSFNATLLHEMGHHVDWHYGGMDWLRRNDSSGFRLLEGTAHRGGGPNGVGEHFADCYMMYMLLRRAGIAYGFPAQPGAYRGEQAQRRFDVLLAVPRAW